MSPDIGVKNPNGKTILVVGNVVKALSVQVQISEISIHLYGPLSQRFYRHLWKKNEAMGIQSCSLYAM